MGEVEKPLARLRALGLELPPPPAPLANYLPAIRHGDLVYVSGHGSARPGGQGFFERVGEVLSVAEGRHAAQLAALNCLAALNALVPLARVRQILKVTGYVHSADGFTQQPEVLNGASDLLVQIFGERGRHARTAVGLRQTARGYSVQLEMIVAIYD